MIIPIAVDRQEGEHESKGAELKDEIKWALWSEVKIHCTFYTLAKSSGLCHKLLGRLPGPRAEPGQTLRGLKLSPSPQCTGLRAKLVGFNSDTETLCFLLFLWVVTRPP